MTYFLYPDQKRKIHTHNAMGVMTGIRNKLNKPTHSQIFIFFRSPLVKCRSKNPFFFSFDSRILRYTYINALNNFPLMKWRSSQWHNLTVSRVTVSEYIPSSNSPRRDIFLGYSSFFPSESHSYGGLV